jgi:DNA polymerase-3 subunit gamma/tau
VSYLAIARKYRPATFDEIVGQEHVTRTLRNAIARDRIHHAFLFCGARGVGKTTAARALAKGLNCEQGPTATPCGVCRSCVEVVAGTSPDLIEIDGASNNSVDDVRELRDTVRYAPQGRRKIYLVDEVHMLSNAAFNALLKTLEEPPPHVVFIFATTEPHKIPDTILSRVQRFDFKRIGLSGVVDRLREIATKEGASLTDNGLRMIARAGEGSMRDSQSLLDKVISFGGPDVDDAMVIETLGLIDRSTLLTMLRAMLHGEPDVCLDVIAKVYGYGHELSRFTSEMLEVVRNATFVRLSESARQHLDLPADELEQLAEITKEATPEQLTRLFAALMDTHEHVARADRPRIVLEMAIARLATVRPVQPVSALVDRLEQLERRARQGGVAARPAAARKPPQRAAGPGGRTRRAAAVRARTKPRGSAPTRASSDADSPELPALPADTPDAQRWSTFLQRLHALKPAVDTLDAGIPRRDNEGIVVTMAGGRRFATAKRALDRDDVQAVLASCYQAKTKLRVEESLTSRGSGIDAQLEQTVLTDPTCQRIMQKLGAVLTDVKSEPGDTP